MPQSCQHTAADHRFRFLSIESIDTKAIRSIQSAATNHNLESQCAETIRFGNEPVLEFLHISEWFKRKPSSPRDLGAATTTTTGTDRAVYWMDMEVTEVTMTIRFVTAPRNVHIPALQGISIIPPEFWWSLSFFDIIYIF